MAIPYRSFRPALAALSTCLLVSGCHKERIEQRPGGEFVPYVAAFTAGHVSARSAVLVRLNDGIVLKDTGAATLHKLFTLDPAVDGTVRWRDPHTLAFQPRERLRQGTTYAVSFKLGDVAEVPDHVRTLRFGFSTFEQNIDLRISDLQSLSPTDLRWQRVVVDVFTSDDATGQDLDKCVTATQDGRTLALHWEHEPGGTLHRAVADSVKRGDKAGSVEFSWNAKAIGGASTGSKAFPIPAIGDMQLIATETSTTDEVSATLLFSDPLDPAQDLSGLAGIAGEDDSRLSILGNKLMIHPPRRLIGEQQAFVAAGLKNVNGGTLGKDITVDLYFEEVKPNVRAVGSGTILPSTDGLLFPFEAVNLNAVDVRIIRIYADNVPQFLQVNDLDGEQELARVARPIVRRTIALDDKEMAKPGEWTRYYLDLDKLLKAEPGAIYRVIIGFRQAYSTYPCGNGRPDELHPQPPLDPSDEEQWDEPSAYYYYDEDGYFGGEYHYEEREDPCTASYFRGKGNVLQRNILASDLGLIAKRGNDGSMLLAVSDLRTTAPVSGVKLRILDLQRRTIAEPVTDGKGLATLPPGERKPFLIVASKGDQRGYLKVDDGSALSVSEFDVQGENVDKGIKGFIYGERGVWRPGDSLHLMFILQQPRVPLPKDIPVSFELSDPLGRTVQRTVRTAGADGMYAFPCATVADAPTGTWSARVSVGGTTFNKAIRIETVKPNRIKVLLDLGDGRATVTDKKQVQLQADWLHGAPAKDLAAKVTVSLSRATAEFKGFKDHVFDDLASDLSTEELTVFDGRLDMNGHASFPFRLDLNEHAPAAVKANLVTRIFEAGGDASMDRTDLTYYPYTSYAGLRTPPASSDWGTYFTDTTYAMGAVAVDASGKTLPGHALDVQVVKVNYDWWWGGDMDGPTNYLSAPSSRVVDQQHLITDANGKARFNFRVDRPLWGRFVVRLSDPASGHVSAVQLYVDWPGSAGRSRREGGKDAAMLRFNSDKDNYAVGDECAITFPSSGKGRALVSIENGSRILTAQWVDLKEKETVFRFPITAEMAPNAFAQVLLIQPHDLTAAKTDGTANDLPIRMYGVIPISVQDAATHLYPVITAPAAIKTDVPFTVDVNEKNGQEMTYTLAIVDEGLLDLTRFKTPDPWGHFYAREALGVRTWDMYDQVIGAFGQQLRRVLALGGSDQAVPAQAAKAQRFKPVVRFVGPFKLAKGKKASHRFTINDYVGSVRVMVVAGTARSAYGSTEKAVPVRKPLMVLATLPRVTGPGETVDLPVTVFAMEAKVKNVRLTLEANDLFTVVGPSTQELQFSSTGERTVMFRVSTKQRIGVGKVAITATGAGERAVQSIEVDVRQAGLPETQADTHVIDPGGSLALEPRALGVAGTNSAYLELSTMPAMDLGARLQFLIDYPHGCLEQTTSKAFPQLFLPDVMDMDAKTTSAMRGNVEAALRKMGSFQTGEGGFAYWPGQQEVDEWTSAYAGHFMLEAEAKGFALPPGVKERWLAYTRRGSRNWAPREANAWYMDRSSLTQAYRLYTLALANAAEQGAMNRLRTTPGIGLQARWMLAAAYALNNRKDVAKEISDGLTRSIPGYIETGWTYGSDLRDDAIIAEALMRMGDRAGAAGVVKGIGERIGSDRWYSTQSTAWALLAVSRTLGGNPPDKAMQFTCSINGAPAKERRSERSVVRIDLPPPDGRGKVDIANTGGGILYARLVRTGVPPPGEEHPASNGLAMAVAYTTMDGRALDPSDLAQGTDFIAVVTVGHPGLHGPLQQLALTQVFPSCWEIRNSRLEGTEAVQANSPFDHQDIRDDRVLTYFNLDPGESRTWRVLLNAAYTGRSHLPSTTCSAMYDNTINARNGGKWVTVHKPGGETTSR